MNTDKTKERPILFSGPMVRAILNGTKTQTRRVVKPQPRRMMGGWVRMFNVWMFPNVCPVYRMKCPYGVPGDRLWVREAWRTTEGLDHVKPSNLVPGAPILYEADIWNDGFPYGFPKGKLRPSIFLLRWASRILLEITSVRVERVQDITEEDAKAEGIKHGMDAVYASALLEDKPLCPARREFMLLWDTLNAKRGFGWDENPWVWVVTFKKITPTSTL